MISSSSMTRIEPRPVERLAVSSDAAAVASACQACLFAACAPPRSRARERQREREARALADGAVAGDRAAVLLHDAVGDRQAEAGALADLLGREERIVDARQLLGRNARARCRRSRRRPSAPSARGHDRQPAALGHRVARVQEQVQEHLLQLVLDALHDRPATPHSSLRTWMLPVRNWCSSSDSTSLMTALQSTGPLSTCAGRARFSRPLTILRGAERLALDLLEHLGRRIVGVGALEQHLREARDAGERRVDLVRDAGREQPDRRHLLGDLQLLLELHARRDVLDDRRCVPGDRAVGVAQRRRRDVDQQRAAPPSCRVTSGTR